MRRTLLLLFVAACAHEAKHADAPATYAGTPPAASAWADVTKSPWVAIEAESRSAKLAVFCGERDAALEDVAKTLLSNDEARRDPDRVVPLLRMHGEPHSRPRVVTATGRAPIGDEVLRAQLESLKAEHTRCGVAVGTKANGEELVVSVAVDALADLGSLSTRARTGEWLTLDAVLHVPAEGARVLVLGPRGLPRTVPASLENGRVRARFALDQPGAFTVQLVADLAHGPQPVLEARVFADVAPTIEESRAPDEDVAGERNDEDALVRLLAAARAHDRAPSMTRDPQLDAIARRHAEQMRDAKRTAHDLGEGDLRARLAGANIEAASIAENVAHAKSIVLAHRILYASPSHRMNMLGNYTRAGLGMARAQDGSIYVCEVFVR